MKLTFRPLTAARWDDLERLFGERGACGGCWCMWWRLARSEFVKRKGEANRRAFRKLVAGGARPGILAYLGSEPVGWCAVEPRERYPVLGRSRALRPVDGRPAWAVTCFFVRRDRRRQGLSVRLIEEAVRHVAREGGDLVEGYPVAPRSGRMPAAFAWTGLVSAFRKAGFEEVARPSRSRAIMRRAAGGVRARPRR